MNLLAAFIFFTRLPFWRICEVPAHCFKHVVPYWPFVGWLTGGVMALVWWLAAQLLPPNLAFPLALFARLLLTGALHEDGLADFCDGFGGGTTRERTLSIMKDSHIGTYGVIGLIGYFLLITQLASALPASLMVGVIMAGDVVCKAISAQVINILPYARREEEAKAKVIYNRMSKMEGVFCLSFGFIPLFQLLSPALWLAIIAPVFIFCLLLFLMKRKLQGYTGDCCGALFLLCELSFYLAVCLLAHWLPGYQLLTTKL